MGNKPSECFIPAILALRVGVAAGVGLAPWAETVVDDPRSGVKSSAKAGRMRMSSSIMGPKRTG